MKHKADISRTPPTPPPPVASYERQLAESPALTLREAEALYGGQGRLRRTYERLSRRLRDLGVGFALVGGFAVFVHGLRRFTEDLDVLTTAAGLDTVLDRLVGHGYATVPGVRRSIRDAETGVRIDFVVTGTYPGDGKPKPVAFPEPTVAEERDGLRVVDLKTLIELKLASGMTATGRLEDLADVQRLAAEHALGEDYAARLNPYVQAKFVELCRS
jgi:hypothetical protein